MVEDTRVDVSPNPEAALKDLEELRLRSTTQYRDLAKDQENTDPILEDIFDRRKIQELMNQWMVRTISQHHQRCQETMEKEDQEDLVLFLG